MPVLIRGIFSGGGKIKDATALPSDVAKGKIFYNNQGRQVGTAETLKSQVVNMATGSLTMGILAGGSTVIKYYKWGESSLINDVNYYSDFSFNGVKGGSIALPTWDKIIYVKVNNFRIPIICKDLQNSKCIHYSDDVGNYPHVGFIRNSSTNLIDIYYQGSVKTVTFYYF